LDNKVIDIIDARCNHEDFSVDILMYLISWKYVQWNQSFSMQTYCH